jgi:hypothetical protein
MAKGLFSALKGMDAFGKVRVFPGLVSGMEFMRRADNRRCKG